MKSAYIVSAFASLLLIGIILGCTSNNDAEVVPYDEWGSAGAGEVMDTQGVYYDISDFNLPFAVVNEPYNFSFCDPFYIYTPDYYSPVWSSSDICQPQSTPSGGNPPYHFQLESGTGFPPMGMTLHPNGLLDGTPTAVGTSTFNVCAVDESGKSECSNTSLKVMDIYATINSVSCVRTTDYDDIVTGYEITVKGTAKADYNMYLGYSDEIFENMNSDDGIGYSDYEEGTDCGSWNDGGLATCWNDVGDNSAISWTFVFRSFIHPGVHDLTAKAAVYSGGQITKTAEMPFTCD
ncbi:MAG: putative Ig domain-containing protein [Candidatus Nanoarchaeia archaeon]|nr:putative Ig domain-containing protein [Candidatus Nanoarchaeia archaeon]MDD5239143.1 putative Ig domain-containing protein [Candidatus Nanoarchaeia archaeon]